MLLLTPRSGVELWSVAPRARISVLDDTGFTTNQPAFSLRGDRVLWGGRDAVRAWTASDGLACGEWTVPDDLVAQAITPLVRAIRTDAADSTLAASFHSDVLIFDQRSGALRARLSPAHRGAVAGIALTPDGRRVTSRGFDQAINVWDAASGELLARYEQAGATIWHAAVSDDGERIATCDESGVLRVVGVAPTDMRRTLGSARNTVHRVRFSPDGSLVACASSDGTISAWKSGHADAAWLSAGDAPLSALAFHPSGSRLAVAAHSGQIELLELGAAEPGRRAHFADAPSMVTWLGYSPDGQLLAVLSGESWCDLLDGTTGQPVGRLEGHSGRVIDAAFSCDGSVLYTVGADGELIAWDTGSRREIFRSGPCGALTRAVAISPDGRTIATGSDDRVIRLWDSATGALRQAISGVRAHTFELAFHPGGNIIFSCGRDPGVQVWDSQSGRELAVLDGHRDMVMSLALSPDGNQLASAGGDRQVLKWDLARLARVVAANTEAWTPSK
jgi:WD40 repeat protein